MMDFPAKFDYWRVMSMRTGTKMEWWPSHCGQRSGMTSIADFDDTFHWGVTIWVANYHSLGVPLILINWGVLIWGWHYTVVNRNNRGCLIGVDLPLSIIISVCFLVINERRQGCTEWFFSSFVIHSRTPFFATVIPKFSEVSSLHDFPTSETSLKKQVFFPIIWLVVDLPLWKIWVRQWEGLSHILWKIKFMFETTNQQSDLTNLAKEKSCLSKKQVQKASQSHPPRPCYVIQSHRGKRLLFPWKTHFKKIKKKINNYRYQICQMTSILWLPKQQLP
jgi:hypothetical protein